MVTIHRYSLFFLIFLFSQSVTTSASALEQITLQLKWRHQFQFAGYYAAKHQGYYRDAGLDVSIEPAIPGRDPVLDVIDGKAEYGVGTSSLLLLRNAGKPVVTLAVIFQHSPYILLTKQSSASQTIHNMAGKRLMLEPQADELVAYLKAEGIPVEKMRVTDHTFSIRDLIDGKVDVMSGYVTDDPHELERAGFPFHAYTPRSAGIDFYGDNLFTTENELNKHPARVKAFRDASIKGWQYAMQHPDEIIDLIVNNYTAGADRSHLKYEAEQVRQLMQPDLVEIGYMNPGRWRHIADVYSGLGMLAEDFSLKPFLFDPNPQKDFTLYYRIVAGLLVLALIIIAILIRDIKYRKQMETVQDKALERLQKIASQVPGVIYQYIQRPDGSSCFPYSSDAMKEIYRVSPEEVRESALKVYTTIHPDDFKDVVDSINKSALNMTVWHHEYRVKYSDGTVRWLLGNAMPQHEPDGSVLWHGFITDITERKLAEQAIHGNEERLRLVLKASNDAPWDWDLENNVLYYSPNWWEMLGYIDNELPSDPGLWERLAHPDDLQRIRPFLENVLEHGPDSYECEFRLKHKDAHYVPVLSRGYIQRDLGGAATRISGVNSNLTERKQIEDDLRESRRAAEETAEAKSRFLAVVSHEFRTPLGLLLMAVDVVERYYETLTPEELLENNEQICSSARQIKSLVDSVLLFSRQEKSAVSDVPALLDIEQICRTISGDIVSVWSSGQTFTLAIQPECGKHLLVETLFQRIVANLLTNAFRFTPTEGFITLKGTAIKNCLVIEVTDTGIGIPDEDQQKIFESFYRGSNVSAQSGIGLGLSIVLEAVREMNGKIAVFSKVGQGSTFRVELPV